MQAGNLDPIRGHSVIGIEVNQRLGTQLFVLEVEVQGAILRFPDCIDP